ncbi:hypothetical protein STCU_04524 [Strigomonas culicis]|nr:hypothetical protein STCU_04524 [Strigomonas culicis]|eukprot:EPY29497.1 hypothetical protein STCU_04524 [Strigomonas culicis]
MSLLNTSLQTIVVRLRDVTGKVTQQKLHNRVFDAYEAKSLVFECVSPQQLSVMTSYGGTIPSSHPVGQPILVDNWSELVAMHKDQNVYQLLPRRAKSNASYCVLKAICCSTGSPFQMEHRMDPIDYKLVFRAADFDLRNQFNAANSDKLPPSLWFDGILKAPAASALVSFSNTISANNITQLAASGTFLQQFVRDPPDGDRHRQLKLLYGELLRKPLHLFLGTNATPGREIVNLGKSKNVFIYSRKGRDYVYQP